MMKLTEFERITAEQIAIEAGHEKPTMQNIIDAVRICERCNTNRVNKNLRRL